MSLTQMYGIPAVAMHQRPGAKEMEGSHFGAWLTRNAVALRTWKRLRVLPDEDEDSKSRDIGLLYAEKGVAYARNLGINAEVTSMEMLGAPSRVKDPNAWLLAQRGASGSPTPCP
jgi:hypothetical protein